MNRRVLSALFQYLLFFISPRLGNWYAFRLIDKIAKSKEK